MLQRKVVALGGALLRHLRLPRLGQQARLFVHLDPLLARNRRDQHAKGAPFSEQGAIPFNTFRCGPHSSRLKAEAGLLESGNDALQIP
jgi:hypothetical protein